jgi:hypothetical protein
MPLNRMLAAEHHDQILVAAIAALQVNSWFSCQSCAVLGTRGVRSVDPYSPLVDAEPMRDRPLKKNVGGEALCRGFSLGGQELMGTDEKYPNNKREQTPKHWGTFPLYPARLQQHVFENGGVVKVRRQSKTR